MITQCCCTEYSTSSWSSTGIPDSTHLSMTLPAQGKERGSLHWAVRHLRCCELPPYGSNCSSWRNGAGPHVSKWHPPQCPVSRPDTISEATLFNGTDYTRQGHGEGWPDYLALKTRPQKFATIVKYDMGNFVRQAKVYRLKEKV